MTGWQYRTVRACVLVESFLKYAIEFDKLIRMIQKQHNVSDIVPAFFIKSLVNLEASINSAVQREKEAKKKMNPSNAKALTAMKQKIKKTMKEYETALKKYHEVSFLAILSSFLILKVIGSRSFRTWLLESNCTRCCRANCAYSSLSSNHKWSDRRFYHHRKGGKSHAIYTREHLQAFEICSRS